MISSSLQEISASTDRAHPREARLQELYQSYGQWCTDMGSMAWECKSSFMCTHTHIYIYICPSIQEALLPNKLKGPNFIERCRAHLGIPHSARASPKLFTTKTLLSGGTTSYCALSQKVLKGAAARMLIYWLCSVLAETDDGSLYSKLLGFAKCKCPMKLFSPPAR